MKPILFSTAMVQAILEGRKTMTRRVVKPEPELRTIQFPHWAWNGYSNGHPFYFSGSEPFLIKTLCEPELNICPYGHPGDVLWVREKFRKHHPVDEYGYIDFETTIVDYAADNPEPLYLTDGDGFVRTNKDGSEKFVPFKPSIHMPKDACRIWLEITNIRVERLQEISSGDAINEGIESFRPVPGDGPAKIQYKHYLNDKWGPSPIHSFHTLWQSINGPGSWEANPFCWVVEFKQIVNQQPKP